MKNISKIEFENLCDFCFHIEIDDGLRGGFYETARIDFKCFDKKNNTRIYIYLSNSDNLFSAVRVATVKDIYIKEFEFIYNYRLLRNDFEKLLTIKAKCLTDNNEEFYKGIVEIVNNAIEKSSIRKSKFYNRYIFPRYCGKRDTFFFSENKIRISKNENTRDDLGKMKTGDIIRQTYGGKMMLGIYDIGNKSASTNTNSDGKEYCIAFPICIILSEDNLNEEEYLESFKPDTNYGNSVMIIRQEDLSDKELDLYNKICQKYGFNNK